MELFYARPIDPIRPSPTLLLFRYTVRHTCIKVSNLRALLNLKHQSQDTTFQYSERSDMLFFFICKLKVIFKVKTFHYFIKKYWRSLSKKHSNRIFSFRIKKLIVQMKNKGKWLMQYKKKPNYS